MRLPHSLRRAATKTRSNKPCLRLEILEDRTLLSSFAQALARPGYVIYHPSTSASPLGTAGPTGLTPTQVRHAYGFDQITFPGGVAGDGSGTTIAIVDAYSDPNISGDLLQFDAKFKLPDPTFTVVNQSGGSQLPAANSGWASEIALDVEWSHAIAPGAKILLVEANDSSFSNLLAGVTFAAGQSGVVAVSMSWGGGEFSSETSYDSTFVTPSGHSGVTFVASSGDNGAPPGYPAISPSVLSAGGTTLNVDSSGNYLGESGWSGSGGGISSVETQPSYQKGVVTQSSTRRTNPDVGYDSDPNTGFPVYDSYNNGSSAPWSQFGGTSAASPQWAALIAVADQGRILAGKGALDGPSQTLPMLYGLSSADFNDVTSGGSQGSPAYNAGPGYDLVTGRGSPIAYKVVADLVGNPSITHFTVSAPASTTAGSAFSATVTALDQNNNVVTNYTGTVHFTSSDGTAVLPANYTFTTSDNGVHTFSVTLKKAGSQTVSVADASASSIKGSATLSVSAASADHLGFGQQPTNAVAGSSISPAVTVQVLDLYNNVVTTDASDSISVVIGANAGGGTLSGTTTATVSNGVASFANLSINKTGTGYTLKASSGTLTSATSGAFNITPAAANQLTFGQQPTNTPAGTSISPAVTVQILDAYGNLATGDSSDSVTIGLGTNPGGGSLSGTLTVTAKSGVATFGDLAISNAGNGYTLGATSGILTGATSATFNITPAGTHLSFSQQPTTATAGAAISPAVTVQVLDANGSLVTTDNSDKITLVISNNPGGGTLSGTTSITVSGGVATFNNLSINKTGTGYALQSSSGTLTAATSAPFDITPGKADHLSFAQQPSNTVAGSSISPAVTIQVLDAYNNVVTTDSSDSVSVAIGTNAGGGTLSGTTTATVSSGVASFANLSINKTGAGYTLKTTSSTLTNATSSTFNITPGSADHLAFAQQPSNSSLGSTITPAVTVQILDVNNNLLTSDNTDAVTLTLSNNPSGATLSGTNPVTASGGVAKFSNLSVNLAGTGYTLGASSGNLKTATSASFNVTGSTVIESFDNGLGLYRVAGGWYVSAGTAGYAAHDGNYGLDVANSSGWMYRNDAAAHVQQGETLSAWVQIAGTTDGRAYFGFGASSGGTLSLVLAPNTGQLIIQDNSGYGFFDLAAVGQVYQTNHWYLIQVAWGTNGSITGRLYNSDGQTLLNTVQATATDIIAGGIAFRAIGHDKYFDTVTVTQNGGAHSVRFGDGNNTNQSSGVPVDSGADAPIFGATGPSTSTGSTSLLNGSSSAVALATRQVAEMFFLSNGSSVSSTAAVANSIGALSSSSSSAVSNFFIPQAAARSAASLQESGLANGSAQVTEQDQDAEPAVLSGGAVEPSDPTLVDEAEELAQLSQRAPREHSGTDAFFARTDLVVRDQVPPPAEGSSLLRAAEKGSAAAVAAFLLGFSGLGERDMKEDPRRRARF